MSDTLDILTEAMSDYFDFGDTGDAYLAGSYVAEHIAKKMTHQRIVEVADLAEVCAAIKRVYNEYGGDLIGFPAWKAVGEFLELIGKAE